MTTQTNQQVVNSNPLINEEFLKEGLHYVDLETPTIIDAGGCGVFALLLIKELEKYNISAKAYAIFDGSASYDTKDYIHVISEFVESNKIPEDSDNGNLLGASHIITKCGEHFWDQTGIVDIKFKKSVKTFELTDEQLQIMVDNENGWNPLFDRSVIPLMIKKLDEVFNHIKDFHNGMFHSDGREKLTEHTQQFLQMKEMQQLLSFI